MIAGGKTLILTKDNGSFLTILNMEVGSCNFVEGDLIYTVKNDGIYSINAQTGRIGNVFKGKINGSARRLEGKIHFLTANGLVLHRGIFDPADENVHLERIQGSENDDGRCTYTLEGIDVSGKFIVTTITPDITGYIKGTRIYGRDNSLIFSTAMSDPSSGRYTVTPVYNESGDCNYISYSWNSKNSSYHYANIKVLGIYNGFAAQTNARDPNGYPCVTSEIVFARELSEKVYISAGAYWTWIRSTGSYGNGPAHGYPERIKVFVFNPENGTAGTGSISELGMRNVTVEYGSSSDTLAVFHTGNNHYGLSYGNETSVATWDQPLLGIIGRYVNKHLDGDKDINCVVIYDETNPSESYTAELLNRLSEKAAAHNGELIAADKIQIENGSLAEAIAGLGEEGHNMLLVSVEEGANAAITKTYSLLPDTEYHYEYYIKSDEPLASDVLQVSYEINQALDESGLASDGYIVTDMYFEDFNDTHLEPFFRLQESRVKDALYYGANVYNQQGSNWENRFYSDSSSLSFTIPQGKKAVLSFDWIIEMDGTQMWMANYIRINGQEWKAFAPQSGSGHYTHPVMLEEGENTLTFYAGAYGGRITSAKTCIDNLRADIVDAYYAATPGEPGHVSAPEQTRTLSIEQTPGGYVHVGGSFRTPPATVAYRAMADAEIISGPIGTDPYTVWTSTEPGSKKVQYNIPADKTAVYTLLYTQSSPRYYNDRNYPSNYYWGNYRWTSKYMNKNPQDPLDNVSTNYIIRLPAMSGTQTFSQESSDYRGAFGDYINITSVLANESNGPINDNRFFIDEGAEGEQKLYIENLTFGGNAAAEFCLPAGSCYIRDLSIYLMRNGVKEYVEEENFGSTEDLLKWKVDGAVAAIVKNSVPDDEDQSLVYRKGQVVDYNIYYYDYEGDPSKKQYWRYTHTPFNDGPHPDAYVILDENGSPAAVTGKILNESIRQFYIDGKYTLEHWQEDNTARPPTPEGNPDYDKLSNVETVTFYISGGATAPWIESIATDPAKVKEGDKYSIIVKVDDLEKDELRLFTEIYEDDKVIYSQWDHGITAGTNDEYPPVIINVKPAAWAGRYEVICTVRDHSGTGIDSYAFTVASAGKIEGNVYHTDLWDQNRKKFNLFYFGDEYNQYVSYSDYINMQPPRKRGVNVFWSGEKFLLSAEVVGDALSVSVNISGDDAYKTALRDTGRKNADGEAIYEGSLWSDTMMNKWGRNGPEELIFCFAADYGDGIIKTFNVPVIIDSTLDYWLLHRVW